MLGLDEAGVGPGFGNLVASAVYLPDNHKIKGIADSKKISAKKREKIFEEIKSSCKYGIGIVTNDEIDALGLSEARYLVFDRALDDFASSNPEFNVENIIVDGNMFRQWREVKYECIPKADATIPTVSAASIIAKVTRDKQILELCELEPEFDERYGISSNKGYLSARHISGIQKYGRSVYHRKSYKIKGCE